ncbi:MAG TPA: GGDEF domain-containing protein [Gammaproteobacteria bacterium]|nr:GGDEF domain-containing protein [Gammaproteobacteria bacterium]
MASIPKKRRGHRSAAAVDGDVGRLQLRGFARTVSEIEWLLLCLILVYLVVARIPRAAEQEILLGAGGFAAVLAGFHYLNFFQSNRRWKLALETWVMIGFITWALWCTGKADSPLLNVYLLVIVISALTLGKLATLLEVAMITACYLYLDVAQLGPAAFGGVHLTAMAERLAPFLLVAYLTTMLADDIHFANHRLRELARTDALTGLYNMRTFLTVAEKVYAQALRKSTSFSVVMFDADNLKRINDQYGHETGNALIQGIADAVRNNLRASDLFARYGGDEFAALLPETDSRGALRLARRILTQVAGRSVTLPPANVPVTIGLSVGIASYPAHGTTVLELINKADRAMYTSKESGKNRVTVFQLTDVA